MTVLSGIEAYSSDPSYDVPSELFHYTTSEGLKGIIENGELWATDRSFLNDRAESLHGGEVLDKHCKQLGEYISSEYPSNGEAEEMVAAYVKSVVESREAATQTSWFVASLCREPNLLTQWIGYGHQGGYCVGFDARGLRDKGESLPVDKRFILRRVIYQFESQLGELLTNARRYVPGKLGDSTNEKEKALQFVLEEALVALLRYKDKSFEREQEWRLWGFRTGSETLHFRTTPTLGVIPFVKLDIGKGKESLIRRVWIGPTTLGDECERAVRLLLDGHDLHRVEIERSMITLRW